MCYFNVENTAVILMGSNIGDKIGFLKFAIKSLKEAGISIIKESSYYASDAWGFKSDTFINQAVICTCKSNPHQLLDMLQDIEKQAGRISKTKAEYEARTLDLDIIFFNNQIIKSKNLIIPHSLMQNRKFVLIPLKEIISKYEHPVLKKNIETLLEKCSDKGNVTKITCPA